jgi:hypothetical protein
VDLFEQGREFFLELDQVLGHLGAVLQAGVLATQAFDLAITRVSSPAAAGLRLKALRALLGKRFAPLAELGCVQAVAPQPGTLLTLR